MAGYALMDLAKYPEGDDVVEDFIFMKLGQLADEWVTGNDDVVAGARDRAHCSRIATRSTSPTACGSRGARSAGTRPRQRGSDYREFYAPLK